MAARRMGRDVRRPRDLVAEARSSAARPDERAASLAVQQHGLITRKQALALGLSRSAIQRRVRAKRWIALRRGVYCFAGTPKTERRDVLEACLASGEDAVASHFTAGVLWDLDEVWRHRDKHVLTLHQKGRRRRAGVVAHGTRALGPGDRAVVDGIPVTPPARTIIDLAGIIPEEKLALTVMDAARRELIEPEKFREDVLSLGRVRGRDKLRRIVEGKTFCEFHESRGEARAIQALVRAGLQDFVTSQVIVHRGEVLADTDLLIPESRVVIQFDSLRHHWTDARRARDLEETRRLRRASFEVIRPMWKDVRVPERFVEMVAGAVDGQRLRLGARSLASDGIELLPSPRLAQHDLERRRAGYV